MGIKKVWIEEGCTLCGVCEATCPEVFKMSEDTTQIIEDADLNANEDCIKDAAASCPAEVIKYEEE